MSVLISTADGMAQISFAPMNQENGLKGIPRESIRLTFGIIRGMCVSVWLVLWGWEIRAMRRRGIF
jgi:hypothetical protein